MKMDNELIEKLDDLVEAVMEGKYGQSTPKGKPYDPDIEVAELKQEIIDLVNQSQWISVDDDLPEYNKWVMVYWRPVDHEKRPYHHEIIIAQFSSYDKGKIWTANGTLQDIKTHATHWQPLPSPPKGTA